jgi:hypothetical protein
MNFGLQDVRLLNWTQHQQNVLGWIHRNLQRIRMYVSMLTIPRVLWVPTTAWRLFKPRFKWPLLVCEPWEITCVEDIFISKETAFSNFRVEWSHALVIRHGSRDFVLWTQKELILNWCQHFVNTIISREVYRADQSGREDVKNGG